jgi:hypothetical protein
MFSEQYDPVRIEDIKQAHTYINSKYNIYFKLCYCFRLCKRASYRFFLGS